MSETLLQVARDWLASAEKTALDLTESDQPKLRLPESLSVEVNLANAAAQLAIAEQLGRIADALGRSR